MSQSLIARVTTESAQIQWQRTDAVYSKHTITIPDDDYWILGRTPATVDGAQTGATITVDAGHDLAADDEVTIYDVSADTIIGTYTVESAASTSVKLDGSVTVGDNDQIYVTEDLLSAIQTLIRGAGGGGENLEASIRISSGIVQFRMGSTQTATLTWTSDGETLRDWLRFSGTTESVTDDYADCAGAQCHQYGYYPGIGFAETSRTTEYLRSTSRADNGSQETHYYGDLIDRDVTIRISDGPRASTYGEWLAFIAFWDDVFSVGGEFRWYHDVTEFRAYSAPTVADGYEVWTHLGPAAYTPRQVVAGWVGLYESTLTWARYS